MSLIFWEGQLLFRNGRLAKDLNCCCEGDGGVCCKIQYSTAVRLRFTSTGTCGLSSWNEVTLAGGIDLFSWGPKTPITDCEPEEDSEIYADVRCEDNVYYLVLTATIEDSANLECEFEASYVRCNPFRLEFEIDCSWCCSGETVTAIVVLA